jgi:hypothetical protein
MIRRWRHVKGNARRSRGGQTILRSTAAAILEAVKGFHRLKGHNDLPTLMATLHARHHQLGIAGESVEHVA